MFGEYAAVPGCRDQESASYTAYTTSNIGVIVHSQSHRLPVFVFTTGSYFAPASLCN